jgi:hypothetical protein
VNVVVDDRKLVIGLCDVYRRAMKPFEVATLLPLAESACRDLGLVPADAPVEGYYCESPELRRFFLHVRALQQAQLPERASSSLARLREVLTSPAFGRVEPSPYALPRMSSPLGEALESLAGWSVAAVSAGARDRLRDSDVGLVAVASATGDPVALCVARESMALTGSVVLASPEVPRYVWSVSEAVVRAARRFVAALADATGLALPAIEAGSAESYGSAASSADVVGRCILVARRVGDSHPLYHWYTAHGSGDLQVRDFWSTEIWTSEQLRSLPFDRWPRAGARVGAVADEGVLTERAPRGWLGRAFRRR